MDDEAIVHFSLKCFSNAILEKENLKNLGCKIVLHEKMLQTFIDNKLNMPLMMKLINHNNDKSVVASILVKKKKKKMEKKNYKIGLLTGFQWHRRLCLSSLLDDESVGDR